MPKPFPFTLDRSGLSNKLYTLHCLGGDLREIQPGIYRVENRWDYYPEDDHWIEKGGKIKGKNLFTLIDRIHQVKDASKKQDTFTLEGRIVRKTPQAYLVYSRDFGELWLPASQTEVEESAQPDGLTTFIIPTWLADKKGLRD